MLRRHRLSFVSLAAAVTLVALTSAGSAWAQVLPMIVDHTGSSGEQYWWSQERAHESGPFDRALRAAGAPSLRDPARLPNLVISRIYRRPDLSPTNARNLGRMADVGVVALGEARARQTQIAWLDEYLVVVSVSTVLLDVESGAELARVAVTGRGTARTPDEATARAHEEAAAAFVRTVRGVRTVPAPRDDGRATVVVRSPQGAAPFVALRAALVEGLAPRAELNECWASESQIALCITPMPGTTLEAVMGLVEAAVRRTIDGVEVTRAERSAERLSMEVDVVPRTAPGPLDRAL